MKLHQLILTILIAGLFSCQNRKDEINIIGKIDGKIPEKVEYTQHLCNKNIQYFLRTIFSYKA